MKSVVTDLTEKKMLEEDEGRMIMFAPGKYSSLIGEQKIRIISDWSTQNNIDL